MVFYLSNPSIFLIKKFTKLRESTGAPQYRSGFWAEALVTVTGVTP